MSVPEKPAPPVVGKVTFNSVELYWDQASTEHSSGGRLRYCIQEEEEEARKGFGNVYNGFAKSNVFRGLDQNKTYRYRLRISNDTGHSLWSQVITVTTTRIPLSGHDLHHAVLNWEVEKVTTILEESTENLVDTPDAFGMSPLMIAAQKGYTSIASTLIAHKADVNFSNTSGKNSMMLACFGGHLKVALQLYDQGACTDTRDNGGSCCLHWAVDGGKTGCIQWLLDNGINVDVEDDSGCSPLIRLASMNGNIEVARILIENGTDVNKMDKIRKSSLMAAALNGNLALVKLLMENGANLQAVNEYGKTALDFAESFGRKEIASYFTSLIQESSTDVEVEEEVAQSEDTEPSDS
ncbi:Fibronectin type 3 and ankyrin repeat domains protein 1 [Desmophyllum pertusum]|uniref:Fibronectin type 3 and ankyrin repeat domains protein 1 n=1 Tax=Desmophyllum pertusum TaxID=174260 RepID=A0A9X0D4L5_9CNID|nr:Fibronectin type 3 and ankyrin repeat domains protein 1 [Desmophyllum pertusum]